MLLRLEGGHSPLVAHPMEGETLDITLFFSLFQELCATDPPPPAHFSKLPIDISKILSNVELVTSLFYIIVAVGGYENNADINLLSEYLIFTITVFSIGLALFKNRNCNSLANQ